MSPIFPSPHQFRAENTKIALQNRPLPPGADRRPQAKQGPERESLRARGGPGLGGLRAPEPGRLTCSRRLRAAAARAAPSTALQPSEAAPPPGGRSVPQPPPPSPRGSLKWRVRGSPGRAAERPASLCQRRVLGPGARRSPPLPLLPLFHAPPAPPRCSAPSSSSRAAAPARCWGVRPRLASSLRLSRFLLPAAAAAAAAAAFKADSLATNSNSAAPLSASLRSLSSSPPKVKRERDNPILRPARVKGAGEGCPQLGNGVLTAPAGARTDRVSRSHLEPGGNLAVTVAGEVARLGEMH